MLWLCCPTLCFILVLTQALSVPSEFIHFWSDRKHMLNITHSTVPEQSNTVEALINASSEPLLFHGSNRILLWPLFESLFDRLPGPSCHCIQTTIYRSSWLQEVVNLKVLKWCNCTFGGSTLWKMINFEVNIKKFVLIVI